MDTEHVRSGAALEGRPAYRHTPGGGQVFRGSTERLPRLPPQPQYSRGDDPELASSLPIEERELEAGGLNLA